jgi:hypothetical protein
MYKLSWFEKIKYIFSDISYYNRKVLIYFMCANFGYLCRNLIFNPIKYYITIYNYIEDTDILIFRVLETFIYFGLGYYIGYHIELYFHHCNHFRNDFSTKFAGHLEWEKKGFRKGFGKKGELSQGDVFSILLIEKYINYPYSPIVNENDINLVVGHSIPSIHTSEHSIKKKERIKTLYKMISLKDNFKIYMYIRHFTKYKINNMETAGIIRKGLERIINNKYMIQKSKERLENYKEELIEYTWHPDRLIKWCEPNIKERWDSD